MQQAERKQETREKVLRAAGAALRAHGPDGVGIADIMRQAGLTHGGFYAHFRNKDDLVAQSLAYVFSRQLARWDRLDAGLAPAAQLAGFFERYLSPSHRDHPATGCPLTTLGNDIARLPPAVRREFDQGMRAIVGKLAGLLLDGTQAGRMACAHSMLAEMVGAVMLSRAVAERALSDHILAEARNSLRHRAGLPPANEEPNHV